jgi:hypothetical protein
MQRIYDLNRVPASKVEVFREKPIPGKQYYTTLRDTVYINCEGRKFEERSFVEATALSFCGTYVEDQWMSTGPNGEGHAVFRLDDGTIHNVEYDYDGRRCFLERTPHLDLCLSTMLH